MNQIFKNNWLQPLLKSKLFYLYLKITKCTTKCYFCEFLFCQLLNAFTKLKAICLIAAGKIKGYGVVNKFGGAFPETLISSPIVMFIWHLVRGFCDITHKSGG